MKVLVADRISPLGVEFLQKQDGFEVVEAYGSSPEELLEISKDVSAIIVRSDTQVTQEVIAGASNLKAVGRAGVGVDNIDIDAATEAGVIVMNTPGGNTIATAELTFTHMLCGTRPIVRGVTSMKEGLWERKQLKGAELRFKTLAVLGLGRIGIEVAKRMSETNRKLIEKTIDSLKVNTYDIVLEIGHGNGIHINYLLEKAKGIQYIGVEISKTIHN